MLIRDGETNKLRQEISRLMTPLASYRCSEIWTVVHRLCEIHYSKGVEYGESNPRREDMGR